jgi:hypothetical protein
MFFVDLRLATCGQLGNRFSVVTIAIAIGSSRNQSNINILAKETFSIVWSAYGYVLDSE